MNYTPMARFYLIAISLLWVLMSALVFLLANGDSATAARESPVFVAALLPGIAPWVLILINVVRGKSSHEQRLGIVFSIVGFLLCGVAFSKPLWPISWEYTDGYVLALVLELSLIASIAMVIACMCRNK